MKTMLLSVIVLIVVMTIAVLMNMMLLLQVASWGFLLIPFIPMIKKELSDNDPE